MDENQKPEPYFPSATAMEQLREREAMDRASREEATPVPEVVQANVRERQRRSSSGKTGDTEALSRIRAVLETMRDQDADFYKASQEHAIRQEEIAERALENARETPTRVDEDGAPAGKKSIWERIFSFVESIFSIFTKGFMAFVYPGLVPIGKALLAIGAAVALAYKIFKDIDFGKVLEPLKNGLLFLWDAVKVLADVLWSGAVMSFKVLDGVLTQFINLVKWALTPVFESLATTLAPVGEGLNDFWQNSVKPAAAAFSEMLLSVGDFFDWFKNANPEELKNYFMGVLRSIPDTFQNVMANSWLGKKLGFVAPTAPVQAPVNPSTSITARRHERAARPSPRATGDIHLSSTPPATPPSRLPVELQRPPAPVVAAPQRLPPAAAGQEGAQQDPKTMTMSDAGYASLLASEGYRANAYQDTRGVWTIGIGETQWNGAPVSPTNPGRPITYEEALTRMKRRVETEYQPRVQRSLRRAVSQSQFDALVHLDYNSPRGAQKIMQKVNRDQLVTQADFMAATPIRANERGLVTRRQNEYAMFTQGGHTTPAQLVSAPTPAPASPTTAIRAAGPVQMASAQLSAASGSPTVIVAPSVVNQSAPSQPTRNIPYPVPIAPRDTGLQALLGINAM